MRKTLALLMFLSFVAYPQSQKFRIPVRMEDSCYINGVLIVPGGSTGQALIKAAGGAVTWGSVGSGTGGSAYGLNTGTGFDIFKSKVDSTLQFKRLTEGTGISLDSVTTANSVIIKTSASVPLVDVANSWSAAQTYSTAVSGNPVVDITNTSTTSNSKGIMAVMSSASAFSTSSAVYGSNAGNGNGVLGYSNTGTGGSFLTTSGTAIKGLVNGITKFSVNSYGVYIRDSLGIYGKLTTSGITEFLDTVKFTGNSTFSKAFKWTDAVAGYVPIWQSSKAIGNSPLMMVGAAMRIWADQDFPSLSMGENTSGDSVVIRNNGGVLEFWDYEAGWKTLYQLGLGGGGASGDTVLTKNLQALGGDTVSVRDTMKLYKPFKWMDASANYVPIWTSTGHIGNSTLRKDSYDRYYGAAGFHIGAQTYNSFFSVGAGFPDTMTYGGHTLQYGLYLTPQLTPLNAGNMMIGMDLSPTITPYGTHPRITQNGIGLYLTGLGKGHPSDTIRVNYGLVVAPITLGSEHNISIETHTGVARFGDTVSCTGYGIIPDTYAGGSGFFGSPLYRWRYGWMDTLQFSDASIITTTNTLMLKSAVRDSIRVTAIGAAGSAGKTAYWITNDSLGWTEGGAAFDSSSLTYTKYLTGLKVAKSDSLTGPGYATWTMWNTKLNKSDTTGWANRTFVTTWSALQGYVKPENTGASVGYRLWNSTTFPYISLGYTGSAGDSVVIFNDNGSLIFFDPSCAVQGKQLSDIMTWQDSLAARGYLTWTMGQAKLNKADTATFLLTRTNGFAKSDTALSAILTQTELMAQTPLMDTTNISLDSTWYALVSHRGKVYVGSRYAGILKISDSLTGAGYTTWTQNQLNAPKTSATLTTPTLSGKVTGTAANVGGGSFSGTTLRAAVYVSGLTSSAKVFACANRDGDPAAGDILNAFSKTDSVIVRRRSSGTSGLAFNFWIVYP
jgi:hypothetical protein